MQNRMERGVDVGGVGITVRLVWIEEGAIAICMNEAK